MGFYHSFIRKLSFLLNYKTSHVISLNVIIEVKNLIILIFFLQSLPSNYIYQALSLRSSLLQSWYSDIYSLVCMFLLLIHHIISHHIVSYLITIYHITSYHIISHNITSHYIISYHTISYHVISYQIISHHITSYQIIDRKSVV